MTTAAEFEELDSICHGPHCTEQATHQLLCGGALVTAYCDEHMDEFERFESIAAKRNVQRRKQAALLREARTAGRIAEGFSP